MRKRSGVKPWSEALLTEWERVIVREQRRSAASAASITAAIREYFSDSEVREPDYVGMIEDMPGNDPDDRPHMAAVIAGRAEVIVTWNLADFPSEPLARQGVRVIDPDRYLCELNETGSDEPEGV